MLSLAPMTEADLPSVERWLAMPHVARWWTPETTPPAKVAKYRQRIRGEEPTSMLTVRSDGEAIGWCQWYLWADYPDEADAMGAEPGDVGIDYAIGEPTRIGHGTGTGLVAALVALVREACPGAGLLVAVEAENPASRRVLEKNGFALVATRPVATEPHERPMALYRRAACAGPGGR